MNLLQLRILLAIREYGPASDVDIWARLKEQESGGSGAVIVCECIDLQRMGYIEPPSNDPNLWQLSNKGLEYVAANLKQKIQAGGQPCS